MAHLASTILDLISGVLISSDLIISKDTAISVNRTLRGWLTLFPPGKKDIKKTFIVSAILAVVGVAAWVTYAILRDLGTTSTINLSWVPIFFGGFAVGLAMQWFLIRLLLRLTIYELYAILFSSGSLIVLGVIMLATTIHHIRAVQFTIGLLYGVSMIEFSILLTRFFTWFSTSDPSPDPSLARNPRVLARIGILLFIVAGIVELVTSLI